MGSYYLPGQRKEFRWGKVKAWFWGFVIGALLFVPLGYGWRMAQTDPEHRAEMRKMKERIEELRKHYYPPNPKEAKKGGKRDGRSSAGVN